MTQSGLSRRGFCTWPARRGGGRPRGCGGDGEPGPTGSSAERCASSPATAARTTRSTRSGWSAASRSGGTHDHEALVDLDEQLLPRPRLAESFEPADGGKTWTFRLRNGSLSTTARR